MAIQDKPTAAWEESDLHELCDRGQREGPRLEFKESLQLDRDRHKDEVEHDVEGVANAGGGHLIYGIREAVADDGSKVASELTPMADGSLYDRLNDVLDARGQPRLHFDLYAITAATGGIYVVVEISGRRRPHQANDGRYYLRRNLLVRQMDEAEVADAYRDRYERERLAWNLPDDSPSRELEDRVHRGLTNGELALYREETGDEMPPGWLSVVTLPEAPTDEVFDVTRVDSSRFEELDLSGLWNERERPLRYFSLRKTLNGFRAQLPPSDDGYPAYWLALAQDGLFEFGDLLIPALRMSPPEENRFVPSHSVAVYIHDYLLLFAAIYEEFGYDATVQAQIRFDDLHGYRLGVSQRRAYFDSLTLRETSVEARPWSGAARDLASQAGLITKDALDRLFIAAGVEGGSYVVNEDGELVDE
jgi:Putative DNA-binding domain